MMANAAAAAAAVFNFVRRERMLISVQVVPYSYTNFRTFSCAGW